MSRRATLPLILTGFWIACAAAAQDAAQTAATTAAAALTVQVAVPERTVWDTTLETNGRLQAWQEAIIAAEVGGQRVESVEADVGSVVHKGDVLATLSSATIQNAITQQQASVQSAEAALELATSDADRARTLSASTSSVMSQQQAAQYLVAERKATADLDAAKAVLASSQLDLDRTKVLAIDDGVISSRTAALGAVVGSGSELFRLIRQNRLEWQAEVPIRFLQKISVGTKVGIPTPNGSEVPGAVRLISPIASETTGRVIVFVAVNPPEDAPVPKIGMLVSGKFYLGQTEALNVPATAVTMRDGFSYAFVLNAGSNPTTVTRKRVEIGRRQGDRLEILSGIEDADQVVQTGGAFLNEGSVVNVVAGQG